MRQTAPIFVLSWVRSGSTLLRMLLDTHPDIACPGEVELGDLCTALVQSLTPTLGQRAPTTGWQLVQQEVRRIAGGVMETYARDKGKPLWCDKSPTNVFALALLESVFPDARFICLYRDGRDVARSSVEYRNRGKIDALDIFVARAGNDLDGAVDGWLAATAAMLRLEARRPDVCHRIHYEELVRAPRESMARMLSWLGVPDDPTLVDRVFTTPHDTGEGDEKALFSTAFDTRSIGSGRSCVGDISGERRTAFDDRLASLGYDVSQSAGDAHKPATTEPPALAALLGTVLPERLREHATELRHGGVFRFVVRDFEPRVWTLDLNGPKPYFAPVDRPTDCTVTLDAATFAAVIARDENAATAFIDGRIAIEGDQRKARVLRFLVK